MKQRLGNLDFKYGDWEFGASILVFRVLDKQIAEHIFEGMQDEKPQAGPKFNITQISKNDFLREFYKLNGTTKQSLSIISREELDLLFGKPNSMQAFAS